MSGDNIYCNYSGCPNPAYMFGLPYACTKTAMCRMHIFVLTDQQVPVFDISAYEFIRTTEDGMEYLKRRGEMEKGLSCVAALEEKCEENWEKAERSIEAARRSMQVIVDRAYKEIQVTVSQLYMHVKRELEQRRCNLERFMTEKDYKLNEEDMLFSAPVVHIGSLFSVVLEDYADKVAEIIVKSSTLRSNEIMDFLREGIDSGLEDAVGTGVIPREMKVAVNSEKAAKRLIRILPATVSEQEAKSVAALYQCEGKKAMNEGNYSKALKKLCHCQDLHQQWNLPNHKLALLLGKVQTHLGNREAAQTELSLELEHQPTTKLALKLHNALALTNFQAGLWEQTIDICEQTLRIGGYREYDYEAACAIYYFSNAHYWLGSDGYGNVRGQVDSLQPRSPRTQCMLAYIRADRLRIVGQVKDSALAYEEGLQQGKQVLSFAFPTACSRLWLGSLYKKMQMQDAAETQYSMASEMFSAHFPNALQHAKCCFSLGTVYKLLHRENLTESQYKKASDIYAEYYPKDIDFPKCLNNLGLLYETQKRPEEAEEGYKRACELYAENWPRSLAFADCLYNSGLFYYSRKMKGKAEERYKKARKICVSHFPHSLIYANTLHNLGLVYEATEKINKSERLYLKACDMYNTHFPQSLEYVRCLNNLGQLYFSMKEYSNAQIRYQRACEIGSAHFPKSLTYVDSCVNLGQLHVARKELIKRKRT